MSVFCNSVNSKKQGDVGMAAAIFWATKAGYTPAIPLTDSQDYDLVIDTGTALRRVQVRTTRALSENGSFEVNLRVIGGNRSNTGKTKTPATMAYDDLFVLTAAGDAYFIPKVVFQHRKAYLTLNSSMLLYRVMQSTLSEVESI